MNSETQYTGSQTDRLVGLAHDRYDFIHGDDGEPYVTRKDRPAIAISLRASSRGGGRGLRSELVAAHMDKYGKVPSQRALAEALMAVEAQAFEREPTPVHLRVAEHEGALVIDLGQDSGEVVVVTPEGWSVTDSSPVLFRRAAPTRPLPLPERGGSLDELRSVLNVDDESFDLIVGWLVAAFFPPPMPHPILALVGQQGSAKSTTARHLISLVDPNLAPLRSQPTDIENWSVAANGSYAFVIDNVSHIPAWWADALCMAVTGSHMVRRARYSDKDVALLAVHRVIVITGISPAISRGDLAERLLTVRLNSISAEARRTEDDVRAVFEESRARIFGALLDLLAAVLRRKPEVVLRGRPRMADFAEVLAAVDLECGTDSLGAYLAQLGEQFGDTIDGDPFAKAIAVLARDAGEWKGTAAELFAVPSIAEACAARTRPIRSASALSSALERIASALEVAEGVSVTKYRAGRSRTRMICLRTGELARN
jgi:hypothetical protein